MSLQQRSSYRGRATFAGVAAAAVALAAFAIAPAQAQKAGVVPGVNAPNTFADVVERVMPSVVSIRVRSGGANRLASRNTPGNRGRGRGSVPFPDLAPDHPLNEFFRNMPGRNGTPNRPPRSRPRASQGSGFVISEDGFVVTNNHVIRGASEIKVSFGPREGTYDAELVGADARTDLALLKIKSDKTFSPVKFANETGRVGDWVVAVGNPFGLGGTVTVGVLSALARDIGSGPYDFIQIDAAVNRGNSGGPTFNLNGEVIGVNTAIYSPSGGNVGIAFAVPASTAKLVIEELKTNGSVQRGWLGVRIQNIDEDIAASLGLDKATGALVNEVTPDGPAQAAGLQAGDAILEVNGEQIEDSRDLARKVAELRPNTTVDVKVRRGARDQVIRVKLGTFPTANQQASNTPAQQKKPADTTSAVLEGLGLEIATLETPRGDIKSGVEITNVEDDTDAARKGLSTGDIILQVNSQAVSKPQDVVAAVNNAKNLGRPAVLLTIQSSAGRRLVAVQFKKDE
jgi:serine protease Do